MISFNTALSYQLFTIPILPWMPDQCALNGRVLVEPHMVHGDMRDFMNGNTIEISEKTHEIDNLATHLHAGNVTDSAIRDSELPYLAAGAYARQIISRSDMANLASWHQFALDYPDSDFSVMPLLTPDGSWTVAGLDALDWFVQTGGEVNPVYAQPQELDFRLSLATTIQKLPKAQQLVGHVRNAERNSGMGNDLAMDAHSALLQACTGRQFKAALHLGSITKIDLLNLELEKHARFLHIPYPGVATTRFLMGRLEKPSRFVWHDRIHLNLLHLYPQPVLTTLFGAITDFRQFTQAPMSQEMWKTGDFDHTNSMGINSADPHVLLNAVLKEIGFIDEARIWGWNTLLYIRDHREQLGIDPAKLRVFRNMNTLAGNTEILMRHLSKAQKIWALQDLLLQGDLTPTKLYEVPAVEIEAEHDGSGLPAMRLRRLGVGD